MTSIEITVLGVPAPQGSKRGFAIKSKGAYTGKVAQVESSAKVKPWRMAVKYAALEEIRNDYAATDDWHPLTGAVVLDVTFRLPRPKGHYGTGRNASTLKDSAPWFPAGRPDLDKLLRSTFDALGEAGVWGDDAQVVEMHGVKHYANDYSPVGATIRVRSMANTITAAAS